MSAARYFTFIALCFCFSQASGMSSILFLGNSITTHDAAPEIGWDGRRGMASSSSDNDYFSRLKASLLKDSFGSTIGFDRKNISFFERDPSGKYLYVLDLIKIARPRITVLFIGDNVNYSSMDLVLFSEKYAQLTSDIIGLNSKLVCVSTWWRSVRVDKIIYDACKKAGGRFVSLEGLSAVRENNAISENEKYSSGVGRHPGDAGMMAISERIYPILNILLDGSK